MSSMGRRRISRSRLELFIECPRCAFLAERLGVRRPSLPSFTLNNAVDALLKREYDAYRAEGVTPPLVASAGLNFVPFNHPHLEVWRDWRQGVSAFHEESNIELYGAIDDVWVTTDGALVVVDYKATSKGVTPDLEGRWGAAYKRQLEIYQWIFRMSGFEVHPTAYILYVNARRGEDTFGAALHFDEHLIPHEGDTSWVPSTLVAFRHVIEGHRVPDPSPLCEYCAYRNAARQALRAWHSSHGRENGVAARGNTAME